MKQTLAFLLFLFVVVTPIKAQEIRQAETKPICKTWYDESKESKIQIYQDGNTFSGKVVWMLKPYGPDGKLRLDENNPEPAHRKKSISGLVILHSFRQNPTNPNEYIDGKVYDPNNGKTYCGKITYKGNHLDLRGFICALSFLGRSTRWTLAE